VRVAAGVWAAVYCGRGMFFHSDIASLKLFAAIEDLAIQLFGKGPFVTKQCFFEHLVYIVSPVEGRLFLLGVGHETFVDIYAQMNLDV
jgi:hypothetical protein